MLAVSPVTLPIPGTGTRAHLEDNLAAAALRLDEDEMQAIAAGVSQP
jgi:pyridoxine 4-dehydrogenase